MIKLPLTNRPVPAPLTAIQTLFRKQLTAPSSQKDSNFEINYHSLVVQAIDTFKEYIGTAGRGITLTAFIVDRHLRKYGTGNEGWRRAMGWVNSWRKHADKEEARVICGMLGESQKGVRIFLKIRKVLLQGRGALMQDVQLSHEDAVTVVYTMEGITQNQRRQLSLRVNQHFLHSSIRFVNSAKINAAIICQLFLDALLPPTHNTSSSSQPEMSFSLATPSSLNTQPNTQPPPQAQTPAYTTVQQESHQVQKSGSLVSLQRCLLQLSLLKQKDQQMDNRFKKLGCKHVSK